MLTYLNNEGHLNETAYFGRRSVAMRSGINYFMNAYSKYITIDNRQIEVKFVKIETSHPQKLSVTVIDFEKTDIAFHVAKDSYGKWNLMQPIPASLVSIKPLLLDLIKDHSKN